MTGWCAQCKRPDQALVRIRLFRESHDSWCCEPCLERWEALGLDFRRVAA